MKSPFFSRLFAVVTLLFGLVASVSALTPPVIRSTEYNGSYSNIVFFPAQPWMNTNTALMTVEAWVYCRDLVGQQAFIARHYTTNLYFGVNGNRLRFYRSGGTSADSDGTLVPNRWTHVAATYDGTTARFYINGALAGTKGLANAGNNCTNSLSLGGEHDLLGLGDIFAGGYAFNGYLDEVRLWSVVRSQSAIAANINAELRSGTGLQATFGSGGNVNNSVPAPAARMALRFHCGAAALAFCRARSAFLRPPPVCGWMETSICSTNIAVRKPSSCARRSPAPRRTGRLT